MVNWDGDETVYSKVFWSPIHHTSSHILGLATLTCLLLLRNEGSSMDTISEGPAHEIKDRLFLTVLRLRERSHMIWRPSRVVCSGG